MRLFYIGNIKGMNKKLKVKNISKETLLVRVDGVKKEIKPGEVFETKKAKELVRLYKSRFVIVFENEKVEDKKEEKKEVKKENKKETKVKKEEKKD